MPTNDTENIYSTEFENDPNPIPSTRVGYDNTESGLEATTVQGAIDELDSKIKASDEASEITYDNTESGLEATDVQGAIDEVTQDVSELKGIVDDNLLLKGYFNVNFTPENATFQTLFEQNGLYTILNNWLSTLETGEIAQILEIALAPSFSSYTLKPLFSKYYGKNDNFATTNCTGILYDATQQATYIDSCRVANTNSTIIKRTMDNTGTWSFSDLTSDTTPVTHIYLRVAKYRKNI